MKKGRPGIKLLVGRWLLTVALVSFAMAPVTADLNETHIFNPDWPPHARFHTTVMLFMAIGLALLGLWLLWKKTTEFKTNLLAAAAIPLLNWGTFFLATLVPGTGAEDHPGTLPVIFGLPLNLFVALMFSLAAIASYVLCRQAYQRQA